METLQDIFQAEIFQVLGWTLLHFVWQVLAVGLALAVVLRLLRKSSANLRYLIACAALVLIVLMPVVTMQMVDVSVPGFDPVKLQALFPEVVVKATPQVKAPLMPVAAMGKVPLKDQFIKAVEPALPYVVVGWLFGVFGLSLWYLGGWTQLQKLRKLMVREVAPSLKAKLQELSRALGIERTIGLMESALVGVPTVVGHLKPVILLPASALTGLSFEEIEAILAHELAHIKRCDYLVNLLQTAVEILGFYHPAVWWVSRKIRVERENCCDDIVVGLCRDKLSYAKALTTMEEIRGSRGRLAVAASGGSLFGRIRRLLGKDVASEGKLSWLPSVMTMMLIAGLLICVSFTMSCHMEAKENGLIADNTIVPGLRVGEYTFDMNKGDVLESLGEPETIFYGEERYTLDDLPETYYMCFDDISFRIVDDSVKEIGVHSRLYKFTDGLGVGDSEAKIKQAFGDDFHLKETEWKDFLIYEDQFLQFEISKKDRTVMEFSVYPVESSKSDNKTHIPATSIINEQGYVVDKIDYPFVNDPEVIGTWESVDFVGEMEDFKVGKKRWTGRGGELFLHKMMFMNKGRLISTNAKVPGGYPGIWTEGLVIHNDNTKTASKYTLKDMEGSTYMFYEWKSGDYTFRHRRPSYYILKKVSSETGELAEGWAGQPSDAEFAKQLPAKIEQLDIDTADLEEVKEIFGKPAQYVWGKETFTEDNLPRQYILVYPASFRIFMTESEIVELRHEHGFKYVYREKIKSGSSLEEVFELIGNPDKTVEGEKNLYEDGVLYKDIDGRKGYCYYARSDQDVRLWFSDYKIIAIYMTCSDYGAGAGPKRGLIGIQLNDKTWPIVDVIPNMPAESAGLQNGDKLIKVNDKDITHITTIRGALRVLNGDGGEKVKLTVLRGGQTLDFEVERLKK